MSVPTLLGVGVEYIPSAVSYFERMRQIEETSEHIIVLAGPISYLLASDAFDEALGDILRESIPETLPGRERALAQVDEITAVLRQRKASYRRRRPGIVNLISAIEMEHFLQNGLVGRLGLPDKVRRERRALARAEAEHFIALLEEEPIGVQIGIVRRHAAACELPDPAPARPADSGAEPVPAGRAAQHPRRRRDDHVGAARRWRCTRRWPRSSGRAR